MVHVAERRGDDPTGLGGGVWLVCKGRPYEGGEASDESWKIRRHLRGITGRRVNAKA